MLVPVPKNFDFHMQERQRQKRSQVRERVRTIWRADDRAKSSGLISGTQVKSREADKLFHKHCFYVVPNFSRSNAAMQPFTVGKSLPGKCSHVMVKKTVSGLWCQNHSGTFSLWLC